MDRATEEIKPDDADTILWDNVVSAHRELARARNTFYEQAKDHRGTLSRAIQAGWWDTVAAVDCLNDLPDDVPALLDELITLALFDGHAIEAKRILGYHKTSVGYQVREMVLGRLDTADANDIRRLAEVLYHLDDTEGLRLLVERARLSDDPEIQEVADDFDLA